MVFFNTSPPKIYIHIQLISDKLVRGPNVSVRLALEGGDEEGEAVRSRGNDEAGDLGMMLNFLGIMEALMNEEQLRGEGIDGRGQGSVLMAVFDGEVP